MFDVKEVGRKGRVLDFDIENRPLSYIGSDFTSSEVTAIAWSWIGTKKVACKCLTLDPASAVEMFEAFLIAYNKADMVTGHYITRHDLPIINGALIEVNLPTLAKKLVSDTKTDLVRKGDLPASQEALATMYGLPDAKKHMSQTEWRAANRLTPEGIKLTRKRVTDDVIQHKALRARLIDAGALGPPKVWSP